MKKFSEIIDYYYKELYPIVKELDKKREEVKKRTLWIFGVIFFFMTLGTLLYIKNSSQVDYLNLGIYYALLIVAIYSFVLKFTSKDYVVEFKYRVIRPLVEFIDPSLRYTPNAHIPLHIFTKSKIIKSRIDRYSGNDYVAGVVDGVKIEFSDVHAQQKHTDSKGRTHYETLFQGMFLRAEFPKHFSGRTVVLPDSAEKIFGSFLGKMLQSYNFSRAELVKMDNPEFEKHFVVYGTDQIEARYILSHSMMERIVTFRKRVGHDISLSFVGGEMFVAVHYDKDTLEPAIYSSLLEYKIAREYIETLFFAMGIVEELKLNQKIWSKR